MTREQILAYQADTDKIKSCPLGAAFLLFKAKCERAWIMDTEDAYTDKNRLGTKHAYEELDVTEQEMRRLLLEFVR